MGRVVAITTSALLDLLEKYYGPQLPSWPTDPYEFIVWWHCGYPPSDAKCSQGWANLKREVGVKPSDLLGASPRKLASVLKPTVMLPDVGAKRLKEIARQVHKEFGGNLRAGLAGPIAGARKLLKQFHSIADPGADRILLFSGIVAIAAVPSNSPHVLVRVLHGSEDNGYAKNYRQAQQAIEKATPADFTARQRAYLLLKRHGQEICKARPKCEICPVRTQCAFFAQHAP